jgi:diguanylate cyclase (GGDEF)-like protein
MSSSDAQAIATRIIEAISSPVVLDAAKVSVGCSVGIASCPADGKNLGEALEAADQALYEAKRSGKRLVRSAEERRQSNA